MIWNWQDITALVIVGIAAVYIATLVLQRFRRRETGACGGGCFGCKQSESELPEPLIQIGASASLVPRSGVGEISRHALASGSIGETAG